MDSDIGPHCVIHAEALADVVLCEWQVALGWGDAPGQAEFLAHLLTHADKTFPRAKPPSQADFLAALSALLQVGPCTILLHNNSCLQHA